MYIIHIMNDIHSHRELKYRPRWLAGVLREAVKHHKVIVLTGARQVGKTTLLKNEKPFSNWHYITLDDYDILSQARDNPDALFENVSELIIDEVQKAPNLLETVKIKSDNNPRFRFVLSGSSNLLLQKQISESLAGRAVYFVLNPLCDNEIRYVSFAGNIEKVFNGRLPEENEVVVSTEKTIEKTIWKGFMPPLLELESPTAILQWWDGYVRTYLERDIRQLSQIDSLPDFRQIMTALALRSGQILNQTEISRSVKMSQPTVHRYINLLETSYMVERLPAYTVNRNKRLVKSPKVMWNDPGLASFLSGYYSPEDIMQSGSAGGLFESLIFLHLNTEKELMTPKPQLYYWRTTTAKEVDFVVQWGRKLVAIEAKLSSTVKYSDIQTLKLFMHEYPETVASLLVYTGNEIKVMDKNIIAVPWNLL